MFKFSLSNPAKSLFFLYLFTLEYKKLHMGYLYSSTVSIANTLTGQILLI